MSFKDEVENIIGHYPECDYNLSKGKDLCDCYAGETAQSIIDLVDRELPKPKEGTIDLGTYKEDEIDQLNDDALTVITFRQGYNRAISEMRAKLKGDK